MIIGEIKKLIIISFIILPTLSSCSDTNQSPKENTNKIEIENTIKERLNDPLSTQFKNLVVNKSENKACIAWNSKNAMGGYGSWKYALLKKSNSRWSVSNMEEEQDKCIYIKLDEELESEFNWILEKLISFDKEKYKTIINTLSEGKKNWDYVPREKRISLVNDFKKIVTMELELTKLEEIKKKRDM